MALEDQCHRSRPERSGKTFGNRCCAAEGEGGFDTGDMADERIEGGALFGGENTGDGVRVTGVRAKAVDGFRGKRHKAAVTKGSGSCFQGTVRYRETVCLSVPLGL